MLPEMDPPRWFPAQPLRLRLLGAPDRGGAHRGALVYRPVREIPIMHHELRRRRAAAPPAEDHRPRGARPSSSSTACSTCTRPFGWSACGAPQDGALDHLDRQEADGAAASSCSWVYSIMARPAGYPLDHPVIEKALRGLEGFTIVEGENTRRLEACQSTWCRTPPSRWSRSATQATWPATLRSEGGGMARRRGGHPPRRLGRSSAAVLSLMGGWAFEFANDGTRTSTTPPRSCWRSVGPPAPRRWTRPSGSRRRLDGRDALQGRRLGGRSTSTTSRGARAAPAVLRLRAR